MGRSVGNQQGSLSRAAWQTQQRGACQLTGVIVSSIHVSRDDVGDGASSRDDLGLAIIELYLHRRVKAGSSRERQGEAMQGWGKAALLTWGLRNCEAGKRPGRWGDACVATWVARGAGHSP